MKQVKEIWRDPKAMAVALANFYKITGVKINVLLTLSGFEDEG